MHSKIFLAFIAIVIIAGGGFFLIEKGILPGSGLLAAVLGSSGDVLPPLGTSTPQTTEIGQSLRRYQNNTYHFQLDFPDTLQVIEYKERDNAISVTFMNADNSQSFEIYVTPYGATQIDQTRFKLDEPSGRYLDPQQVVIDGAQATLFTGYNPIMGDTREVWFIHGGYLYEVATYKDLDAWLGGVMQNFKFL